MTEILSKTMTESPLKSITEIPLESTTENPLKPMTEIHRESTAEALKTAEKRSQILSEEAPVDLVCPWVDSTDPAWQQERSHYEDNGFSGKPHTQFRNWGLMRYWFRGVERSLPWIRTIHFVTWGHLPPWLDTNHPKLHIVRHEAFIPEKYLPTFNSDTISLNVHRIPGLSEQYIYANDDMFFLRPADQEMYFRDGLPCDSLRLLPITEICDNRFGYILWNDVSLINRHFKLPACRKEHPEAFFSSVYPETQIRANQRLSGYQAFPGFEGEHLPQPLLKATAEAVWKEEKHALDASCMQKFRGWVNHNDWLFRYWNLASGRFVPYLREGGAYVRTCDDRETLKKVILSADHRVICINEGEEEVDFPSRRAYLASLLEQVFPERSSFEKD